MLRKFMLALTVSVIIYTSGVSQAATFTSLNAKKYKGPLLRSCSMYQLGENEYIIKLSGRDIPLPECNTEDTSLYITLKATKIYHPEKIIASMKGIMDTLPMMYNFNAENISDDASFYGRVTVSANFPLKVQSILRSHDGFSLRLKHDADQNITPSSVIIPPPKVANTPQNTVPFNVSTKITLELRDAELRDVIRGIMSYIGRNVIIDPSFPNNVLLTMTMNNVRADEILNHIMRTYDLACYSSGENTLTFGSVEGLYKLSGERSVKQFRLHYAEPAQVSTMLTNIAALEAGAVTIDERMKTVYVRTNPAKMEEVEELIALLDSPLKQVMIRASIFEFNDNDTLTVQNALDVAYDDIRLQLGGPDGLRVNYTNDRSIMQTPAGGTARIITDTLNALEQKVKGRVLANPSVIAIEGKQATINLTQDYPYVSDRDNEKGTVTWSTEEVGPKLTFTPRIGRDGYVTLTLDISTGDVIATQTSSTGEQMPVTTTRSVKTDVRVRDGMPFVIGGLFMEETGKNVSRIPILGNIPLLGELFTFRHNTKTKSQVVMIITPYILDSD